MVHIFDTYSRGVVIVGACTWDNADLVFYIGNHLRYITMENACTVFIMKKILLSQTIMHWKMHVQFVAKCKVEFLLI